MAFKRLMEACLPGQQTDDFQTQTGLATELTAALRSDGVASLVVAWATGAAILPKIGGENLNG